MKPIRSADLVAPVRARQTLPRKLRDIQESEEFAREKALIEQDAKRLDAMLDGATGALSAEPELGYPVEGTVGLWGYSTTEWPGAPSVTIFYTFDADVVVLESIVRAPRLN